MWVTWTLLSEIHALPFVNPLEKRGIGLRQEYSRRWV